jgi:glycosyltransferase involved in cell wall biosynthesis
MTRTRVLIVTHETIGPAMAGPGIRAIELARQISGACDVTLASSLALTETVGSTFPIVSFADDHGLLFRLAAASDILVLQGLMLRRFPKLGRLGKRIVMDLYDPFVFESYPQIDGQSREGKAMFMDLWDIMNEQMDKADFFLCASERQRDMYLGWFCALGRLRPEAFREDPSFRRLVDVVPFGTPEDPPRATGQPAMRGRIPGIGPSDRILLWGGGIWNWFDPLTVIRAVGVLAGEREDVKLVFMGTKPPNPELPEMSMAGQARALGDELGLTGRHVFFLDGWVPYNRRQDYLLEADLGISSHFDAIETRFAFRTRVLDYFWAGLPVLTTDGDSMAEWVREKGLGRVIPPGSVEGWVEAIRGALGDRGGTASVRARVEQFSEDLNWSVVARPLVAYCVAPWDTPRCQWPISRQYERAFRPRFAGILLRGWKLLREEGAMAVLARVLRKLGRVVPRGAPRNRSNRPDDAKQGPRALPH